MYDAAKSTCWFKNGSLTYSELSYGGDGFHTAIASTSQFVSLETACPFTNQSIQKATNGMNFQIECGLNALTSDFNGTVDKYYKPYHANSLADCMNWCADGTPLCYGVAFNPDLSLGYRNCYPKNSNVSDQLHDQSSVWNLHAALVQITYNNTCNSGLYNSSDGKAFGLNCGSTAGGPNIGQVHQPDFGSCIDYCSTYTNGSESCTAAVYQPDAADSYENCYLKSPVGSIQTYPHTGYNFAVLASSSFITNSTSSSSSAESKSLGGGGKAWIAGAVIGPIAVIALLVGAFMWRRKKHQQEGLVKDTLVQESEGAVGRKPAHSNMGRTNQYSPVPTNLPPGELSDGVVYAAQRNRLNEQHELPPGGRIENAADRTVVNEKHEMP